jgi:hypothetical protein
LTIFHDAKRQIQKIKGLSKFPAASKNHGHKAHRHRAGHTSQEMLAAVHKQQADPDG